MTRTPPFLRPRPPARTGTAAPPRVARIAVSAIVFSALLAAVPGDAQRPARAEGEGPEDVFFREPDKATAARIRKLLSASTEVHVLARREARAELEELGPWSYEPLITALTAKEAPVRCAASLVLDAIGDPRALPALREAVLRETSHPQAGAFAALALGRFRDPSAVPVLRTAVGQERGPDNLRAAAAFVLARIRSAEARQLLEELLREPPDKEPIVSARLLALGFFPETALVPGTAKPGPVLERAFGSRRSLEAEAAVLGYLVATARRREGRDVLLRVLEGTDERSVVSAALLGLAAFDDVSITDVLCRYAEGRASDSVRELAADLLVARGDTTSRPTLLRLLRASATTARLRASCLLALGGIADTEAGETILSRLGDRHALVRAAAAVASTRIADAGQREDALRRIDARLRGGESDKDARAVFDLARAVLRGERRAVVWPEVGQEFLFSEATLSWEARLLRAVNRRMEASLDLEKIHILDNDTQIATDLGVPSSPDIYPDGTPREGPPIDVVDPGDNPAAATKVTAYQEQRDLKVELRRRPYFTAGDLPGAPDRGPPTVR